MTYARLPELAKKANVRYEAGSFEIDQSLKNARSAGCTRRWSCRATTRASGGSCSTSRRAPDFLIIDGVTLAQGEVGKPLTLTLEVSTYYRIRANGS